MERLKKAYFITEEQFVEKKREDHVKRMHEVTRLDALLNENKYRDFTPQ